MLLLVCVYMMLKTMKPFLFIFLKFHFLKTPCYFSSVGI